MSISFDEKFVSIFQHRLEDLHLVWGYIKEHYGASYQLYELQMKGLEEEYDNPDNFIKGDPEGYANTPLPCMEELTRRYDILKRRDIMKVNFLKSISTEQRTDEHIKEAISRILKGN